MSKKATLPGKREKIGPVKKRKSEAKEPRKDEVCVYVKARKNSNQAPETKEPKETGLHHAEPTCPIAVQASRVKEPRSGCLTQWKPTSKADPIS